VAATHTRSLALVGGDGTPIGVLQDVDALRSWTLHGRR